MKKEVDMDLFVEMMFTKKIDMTEFQEQTIKVGDINSTRKNYILSKMPDSELVKNIVLNMQHEIEKLGFEVIKNCSYSSEHTPETALIECLKDKLQENLFNGKKSK